MEWICGFCLKCSLQRILSMSEFYLLFGTGPLYKYHMSRNHSSPSSSFTVALAAAVVALSPLSVLASDTGPIYSFDFSDSYYRANGIEPTKVINRVNGNDGISIVAHTSQSNRRDVRALLTVTTYDHSGNLYFF